MTTLFILQIRKLFEQGLNVELIGLAIEILLLSILIPVVIRFLNRNRELGHKFTGTHLLFFHYDFLNDIFLKTLKIENFVGYARSEPSVYTINYWDYGPIQTKFLTILKKVDESKEDYEVVDPTFLEKNVEKLRHRKQIIDSNMILFKDYSKIYIDFFMLSNALFSMIEVVEQKQEEESYKEQLFFIIEGITILSLRSFRRRKRVTDSFYNKMRYRSLIFGEKTNNKSEVIEDINQEIEKEIRKSRNASDWWTLMNLIFRR